MTKKILLTTLNAKYVHTSLALWYLYQYSKAAYPMLLMKEYNINQDLAWVTGEIYLEGAAVVAFSCNIWNIESILIICQRLKIIAPETTILLGGSEVWTKPEELLLGHPSVDYIIVGEGELAFRAWLDQWHQVEPKYQSVPGLVYRIDELISKNESSTPLNDLSQIPSPYPIDLSDFTQKLVYYESTRGCPNRCQYCLSGNETGVRYFPLERVKQDLQRFIEAGIAQVKFVDRTFNVHLERAKEIWRYLIAHPGQTNFHFEIMGDLLDEESLEILALAPAGMFQFEIGVQSTNPTTLKLIQRRMNFERLSANVEKLRKNSQVFLHLDLIAGLPEEDWVSFAKTFNDNLRLRPHRLQLGFLKLIRGSGLRAREAEFGYIYTQEPPYEVLKNDWLDYASLLKLKTLEDLLERYYNSGRFVETMEYLCSSFSNEFAMFEALALWWKGQGLDQAAHKGKDLYRYLLEFGEQQQLDRLILQNLLKFDLLKSERMVELPSWAGVGLDENLRDFSYQFWQDQTQREKYLPSLTNRPLRELQRRVLFAKFDLNPVARGDFRLKPTLFLFVYEAKLISHFELDV